ncbi:hypothetical protein SFC19_01645 [Citrobacter portucalensis]|uniref:hypothetical protein n=1 Tax=Citrobacter portucalensis TaxID=1639133 RepID=UPI003983DAB8
MTALNKQALREEFEICSKDRMRRIALALLDELEAVQQGFIANQEEANEAIKYATELKEQLARACAGREEAFREVDEMQKSLDHTHRRRAIWRGRAEEAEDKLEAAGNLIAELEAREVTLPQRLQPGADGYDDWYVHSADDGEYLKADDVIAALRAAGIGVKGD